MSDEGSNQQRAVDIAEHDLRGRVDWAERAAMTVSADDGGYTVSFLRRIEAGEAMIGGRGGEHGVSYRISRSHEIVAIT